MVQVVDGSRLLLMRKVTVDGSQVVVTLGGSSSASSSTDAGAVAVAVAVAVTTTMTTVAVGVGVVGDKVVNPQFLQHQLVAVLLFEPAPFVQHPRRVPDLGRRKRHDQELVLALVVGGQRLGEPLEDDGDLDVFARFHKAGIGADTVELGGGGLDLEREGVASVIGKGEVFGGLVGKRA